MQCAWFSITRARVYARSTSGGNAAHIAMPYIGHRLFAHQAILRSRAWYESSRMSLSTLQIKLRIVQELRESSCMSLRASRESSHMSLCTLRIKLRIAQELRANQAAYRSRASHESSRMSLSTLRIKPHAYQALHTHQAPRGKHLSRRNAACPRITPRSRTPCRPRAPYRPRPRPARAARL